MSSRMQYVSFWSILKTIFMLELCFQLSLSEQEVERQYEQITSANGADEINDNSWSQLYTTFVRFDESPMNESEALQTGWILNNTGGTDGDGCNNGPWYGRRYVQNKDIAVMLLFDTLGQIAGFQLGLDQLPKNSNGPWELVGGIYILTLYFRDPLTICSKLPSGGSNPIGDRLWLKTNETSYLKMPLTEPSIIPPDPPNLWVKGPCNDIMGTHYWWSISSSINCTDLFPVFLLYNGGLLSAFGFVMLVSQSSYRFERSGPQEFQRILPPQNTPKCLFQQQLITSLHVYMTNPLLDKCSV